MESIVKNKNMMAVTFIIIGILIVGIIIFLSKSIGEGSINIDEQISLGEKYLLELDYDNAIIAFNKVIKVDPMNVKAYIGLSDAHIGKGEIKEAAVSLEIIYEKTKDNRIIEFISELKEEIKKAILFSDFIIPGDEIMVAGVPILETSYDSVVNTLSERYPDNSITDRNITSFVYGEDGSFIYVSENADNSNNIHMYYENPKENMPPETIITDISDISIGDSLESVLYKLGFSKIGIYYILSKNMGIDMDIYKNSDLSDYYDYNIAFTDLKEGIKYIQLFPSNEHKSAKIMMEFSSDNILVGMYHWVNNKTAKVNPNKVIKPNSGMSYYDERIYYNPLNEAGIFSMNMDGSDRKKVTSNSSRELYIDSDYIYYATFDADTGAKLYRVKLDGTDEKLINNDNALYMVVYDGWVYYLNFLEYNHTQFIRYNITDSTREIIYDNSIQWFVDYYIYDDAIYLYSGYDSSDSGRFEGVTKINTKDLNEREMVYPNNDIVFRNIAFSDDWIYFTIPKVRSLFEYDDVIMRCDYEFKNMEVTKVMSGGISCLNIWKNSLAYGDNSGDIYLMDIESGAIRQVIYNDDSSTASIYTIIGDWMFYGIYTVKVDEMDGTCDAIYGLNLNTEELIDMN